MSAKSIFRLLLVGLCVILLTVGFADAGKKKKKKDKPKVEEVKCDYNSCVARYGKAGYCTDYVASRGGRIKGHAKDWYSNANGSKGKEPRPKTSEVFS